jgi:hypothetical protein
MKVGQKEFNAETGEEIFSERELTAAEIKAKDAVKKAIEDELAAVAQKAAEKAALLTRLGLTEDEAKLLLS